MYDADDDECKKCKKKTLKTDHQYGEQLYIILYTYLFDFLMISFKCLTPMMDVKLSPSFHPCIECMPQTRATTTPIFTYF